MRGTDSVIILLVLRQWQVLKDWISLWMKMIGGNRQRQSRIDVTAYCSFPHFIMILYSFILNTFLNNFVLHLHREEQDRHQLICIFVSLTTSLYVSQKCLSYYQIYISSDFLDIFVNGSVITLPQCSLLRRSINKCIYCN